MGSKVKVEKFIAINKASIKGRAGHTRTGACTSRGKCYHGPIPRPTGNTKGSGKKKTSKIG